MIEKRNDTYSLVPIKLNFKYHIVFIPKYRRKVFMNKRMEVRRLFRIIL